jgi:hypothetical protein
LEATLPDNSLQRTHTRPGLLNSDR